mgnify:CR=1 FL=1
MTKKDFIIRSYCEEIFKGKYILFPTDWISISLNKQIIKIPSFKKHKMKKNQKYKISEERILEITNLVIKNKAWPTTIENEVPELLQTVKYWKNQHDNLLEYLNTEIKTKANEVINLIYKIIDDNTKDKI